MVGPMGAWKKRTAESMNEKKKPVAFFLGATLAIAGVILSFVKMAWKESETSSPIGRVGELTKPITEGKLNGNSSTKKRKMNGLREGIVDSSEKTFRFFLSSKSNKKLEGVAAFLLKEYERLIPIDETEKRFLGTTDLNGRMEYRSKEKDVVFDGILFVKNGYESHFFRFKDLLQGRTPISKVFFIQLDFRESSDLRVEVCDAKGLPISGAKVYLSQEGLPFFFEKKMIGSPGNPQNCIFSGVSRSQGLVSFKGLPAGDYYVRIDHFDYLFSPLQVKVEKDRTTILKIKGQEVVVAGVKIPDDDILGVWPLLPSHHRYISYFSNLPFGQLFHFNERIKRQFPHVVFFVFERDPKGNGIGSNLKVVRLRFMLRRTGVWEHLSKLIKPSEINKLPVLKKFERISAETFSFIPVITDKSKEHKLNRVPLYFEVKNPSGNPLANLIPGRIRVILGKLHTLPIGEYLISSNEVNISKSLSKREFSPADISTGKLHLSLNQDLVYVQLQIFAPTGRKFGKGNTIYVNISESNGGSIQKICTSTAGFWLKPGIAQVTLSLFGLPYLEKEVRIKKPRKWTDFSKMLTFNFSKSRKSTNKKKKDDTK